MDGLVLTGGNADAGGSGDDGGAIFSNGTVTITNSVITGNSANDDGGAIQSFSTVTNAANVTIIDSTISDNTAGGNGGGLSNTTFTATTAGPNASVISVINSTISGNRANVGGGIASLGQNNDNSAVVNVVNTTISGNEVVFGGGGIYNRGQTSTLGSTIAITNSTITQNSVTNPGSSAGGILSLHVGVGANIGLVTVGNSIVAGNTATVHPDVRQLSASSSPFVDEGNNLIGIDDQGAFTTSTLVGTTATPLDPLLDELADNSGLTSTHLPFDNSPSLEAGSNTLATTAALTTDQRGFNRFVGAIDIGAVERQESVVSILATDDSADENTAGDTATFRISRTEEFAEDLTVLLALTFGTDLEFSDFTLTGGDISIDTAANTAQLILPTGQDFVDIILTPNDDSLTELDEALTLALVDTDDYEIDASNNAATGTIVANDATTPVSTAPNTPDTEGKLTPSSSNNLLEITSLGSANTISLELSQSGLDSVSEVRIFSTNDSGTSRTEIASFSLLEADKLPEAFAPEFILDSSEIDVGSNLQFELVVNGEPRVATLTSIDDDRVTLDFGDGTELTVSLAEETSASNVLVDDASAIDLTGFDGETLDVEIAVYREALLDNTLRFYTSDFADGGILTDPLSGTVLRPGDVGYRQAAIDRLLDIELSGQNNRVETVSTTIDGGGHLGMFVVVDGTDPGTSELHFSHAGVNDGNLNRVRKLGSNTFGFEDMPNLGDRDFDDIVVEFSIS